MDLIKGTLDVLILGTLREGPLHGYAITRRIRETTEELLLVAEGALYPALRRLEKGGFVRSSWGVSETGREARFYELTPVGRQHLAEQARGWRRYVEAMARVLRGAEGTP